MLTKTPALFALALASMMAAHEGAHLLTAVSRADAQTVTAPAATDTPVTAPADEPSAVPPANREIKSDTKTKTETKIEPKPEPKPETKTETKPETKPGTADSKKNAVAARDLFGARKLPSLGRAMAIGYYPRGCLSGGIALPTTGPNWQVMRLSRNRNWGHPTLIRFVEKFAAAASKATGWKGILVGDLAQPRGGPTPSGHMSHQTGLDVDIWFMPMPDHKLSRQEREDVSATNLVADDWKQLNPKFWTPQHIAFIRTAAESPEVERVLVNAAIKKELCRVAGTADWMKKVRPWYGHHDHIHVRLRCPEGSDQCRKQPAVGENDNACGKSLDFWFSDKVLNPNKKFKPVKPLTLADLPPACKTVLNAPAK